MREISKRSDSTTRIAVLIEFSILVHLMLSPLAYTTNMELAYGKQSTPFALSEDAYIIDKVDNYEIINNVKINSILSRHLRSFDRLLKRLLDTVIQPVLTITILLIYSLVFFKSTGRRKSLLAFSLGGHAPPIQ